MKIAAKKIVENALRATCGCCFGVILLSPALLPLHVQAQTTAPYLLPYTISTYAGGGTAPTVGGPCVGETPAAVAADKEGDGCKINSSSVVIDNLYGVAVSGDKLGNIYFTDDSSSSGKGTVREIVANSGLIHVFIGNSSKACQASYTSYGDGCPANDGLGNAVPGYTPSSDATGIAIAGNGDVYIAGGGNNVVQKVSATTGIMTVVAGYISGGNGSSGYTGDGGPALSASMGSVYGVAVDPAGNIYIADESNNVIRKVTASTGIISTIGGFYNPNGQTAGYTGDGGPATQATLSEPYDVAVDANGNVFEVEYGNSTVRVIYEGGAQVANLIALENPSITASQVVVGDIYTLMGGKNLAGVKASTASSDNLGTMYELGSPRKIALDSRGNLYVSESGDNLISFLDGTSGYARIIAGINHVPTAVAGPGCATSTNAVLGDGCPATQATVLSHSGTIGVGTDPYGNFYIDDGGNLRVRKVSTDQVFPATAEGSSVSQTLEVHFAPGDSPAAATPFVLSANASGAADYTMASPSCTTNNDNTVDCLVVVTFTPTVPGNDAATLTVQTTLGQTSHIALSGVGDAPAVAIDPGTATVFGSGFKAPGGMVEDGAGNTYIADTGNNRILRYTPAGVASVVAGTGTSGYAGDGGAATSATLAAPQKVAVGPDDNVYIADTGNNVIRRVDAATGIITTVAGGASANCTTGTDSFGDGCLGTQMKLSAPAGVAVDTLGNVYFSDTGNSVLHKLTPSGYVYFAAGGAATVCGSGDFFGNGCPAGQAIFKNPTGLQTDAANDLYIADTGDNEVRELVNASNTVIGLAGDGQAGGYGDTGPAVSAQLNGPTGVAVDAAGDVYIADTGNHVVRLVNASGDINTVAGTLSLAGTGTTGSASTILFKSPGGIASTGNGQLFVLDSGNNRLVSVSRASSSHNFGSVNPNDMSSVVRLQETSTGTDAATLSSPLFTTTGSASAFTITPDGSNGCNPNQNLTSGESCYLAAQFVPTALGPVSATFTETATDTAVPAVTAAPITISLTGTGANLTRTSSVTVLTTPNPPYGTNFGVQTTITPASCSTTATNCALTGTVTYYVDGVAVGAPVPVTSTSGSGAVGTAVGSIGGQNEGNHTVVAVYSGDSNYESSTAPALTVAVAGAVTTTSVVATPAVLNQFQPLTLTATVSSSITSTTPTGTVMFYAGTTLLGEAGLNSGVATLADNTSSPTTLGLYAGVYNITAKYVGDINFSPSASAAVSLTVNADPQAISLLLATDPGTGDPIVTTSATMGTAQGSTVYTTLQVTATNTVNDTLTFSCSNLPTDSVCTFLPQTLAFTPVPGAAVPLTSQVTLWTDVNPAVIPTTTSQLRGQNHSNISYATLFGWPVLLLSFAGLFTFRKRLHHVRLLTVFIFCGLLTGSTLVMNGCGSGSGGGNSKTVYLTPTGTYTITLTVSGPHTPSQSIPIYFTVAAGVPGQE